jgi:hypothetical protein
MDITVTGTGKTFYGVDPLLGGILCEAFPEAFRRVERKLAAPAIPAKEVRWSIGKLALNDSPILTLTKGSGEVLQYPGPSCFAPTAEGAQRAFTAGGFPVPQELLHRFATLLKQVIVASDLDLINEARARAANEQYSREAAERLVARILTAQG